MPGMPASVRALTEKADKAALELLPACLARGANTQEIADELNAAGLTTAKGLRYRASNAFQLLRRVGLYEAWKDATGANAIERTKRVVSEKEAMSHANDRPCHGWTDANGKRHPCPHKAMTSNYRCPRCHIRFRVEHGVPLEREDS